MSNDVPNADPPGESAPTPKRRGLEGRTVGGRYRVVRTVAAGANTLIADALDTELDRDVTIKLVRPELSESPKFRSRFVAQMEAIRALSHPNLAALYDYGEERIGKRVTVYTVGEFLSGGSLRDLFDRRRFLTPSQALMIGLEACRGLDFAHRKGLVHTELTPSKLVFGDDRRLRIVDFGLARILGEQVWTDPSQLPTHVARYASPEQALGETVEGKSDVYSLALILIEAVTGAVPFVGDSTVSTLSGRIGKLMTVSADLGPLASVLERAGRPDADERWSASQFGRSLVRSAERMGRPAPIPILAPAPLVDDPAAIRRPNDPTGGINRPPDDQSPILVPPPPIEVDAVVVDETAAVDEIDVASEASADVDAARADRTDAGTDAAPATDDGADPAPAIAQATPLGDKEADAPTPYVELAALVERTPPKAPADDLPDDEGAGGRSERRETKAAEKAAAKLAKQQAKSAKRDGTAAARGGLAADAPFTTAPRRRRWLATLFGIVLVAALALIGLAAWRLFKTPTHEIPNLAGLSQEQAEQAVEEFGWDVRTDRTRDDTYDEKGEVVRTSPAVGYELAEGSPLTIYVSDGPEFRALPDLSGLTLAEATARLEELSLVAGEPKLEYDEDVPADQVISNSVPGVSIGGDVLPGTTVDLVVSQGPLPRAVPSLRGLTPEAATQLLAQYGLTLEVGEPIFDNDVESGGIATQSPAAGEKLERGGAIKVEPSKGPDFVVLPDLAGMNLQQIQEALSGAGLKFGTVLLGSTAGTFYQAQIDGVEVTAGEQVIRGSVVNVIIL